MLYLISEIFPAIIITKEAEIGFEFEIVYAFLSITKRCYEYISHNVINKY